MLKFDSIKKQRDINLLGIDLEGRIGILAESRRWSKGNVRQTHLRLIKVVNNQAKETACLRPAQPLSNVDWILMLDCMLNVQLDLTGQGHDGRRRSSSAERLAVCTSRSSQSDVTEQESELVDSNEQACETREWQECLGVFQIVVSNPRDLSGRGCEGGGSGLGCSCSGPLALCGGCGARASAVGLAHDPKWLMQGKCLLENVPT